LRAWSTLLSRTRTCTRAPFAVYSWDCLVGWGATPEPPWRGV